MEKHKGSLPAFPTTKEIHDNGRSNTMEIIKLRGQVQAKMQQVEQLQREIAQLNDKMCYHADKAAEAIIKLHERT